MIVEVKCKALEAWNCAEIDKNATRSKFVPSILQRIQSDCPNNSIEQKNFKRNSKKFNLEQELLVGKEVRGAGLNVRRPAGFVRNFRVENLLAKAFFHLASYGKARPFAEKQRQLIFNREMLCRDVFVERFSRKDIFLKMFEDEDEDKVNLKLMAMIGSIKESAPPKVQIFNFF